MASFSSRAMADVEAVEANAGVEVSDLEESAAWVLGTFVATVQLQVSPDGTNWINEGSAITAPGKIEIPKYVKQARLNVTAYTSGTVEGVVTGIDTDRKG